MPGGISKLNERGSPALAAAGALLLAFLLFLIIPLSQAFDQAPPKTIIYREVKRLPLTPPKPRDKPIEPEALTSPSPKPKPEIKRTPQEIPLQRLALSLSPGMGVSLNAGIPSLGGITDLDVADELERILSYEDLAEPPKLMNGNALRMDYPIDLARQGIRQAEAVLEIIIGQDGRVTVEKIRSLSYEHPRLREAAVRLAVQMKFSTTTVDGRPVRVRAVIPLTLKAPR